MEQILGIVWLVICVIVLGFGVSSYLHTLCRADNNKNNG